MAINMNKLPGPKTLSRFQAPLQSQGFYSNREDFFQSSSLTSDGFLNFRSELHEMFDKLEDTSKKNTGVLIETFAEMQKKEFFKATVEIGAVTENFIIKPEEINEKLRKTEEINDLKSLVSTIADDSKAKSKKFLENIAKIQEKLKFLNINPTKRRSTSKVQRKKPLKK